MHGDHFALRANIDAETLHHRFGSLYKQLLAQRDGAAYIIRQPAVGDGDLSPPVRHSTVLRGSSLSKSPQTCCGSGAAGNAAYY